MEDFEPPTLRPLIWLGNSKRSIRGFPEGAQKLVGDELQLIQFGGMPKDAKPFKGIGSGVLEIAIRYDTDALPHGAGGSTGQQNLRAARLPKEGAQGQGDAKEGRGFDQAEIQ